MDKLEPGNSERKKSTPKPNDCKICENPRARRAKGKRFEDPKNKDWQGYNYV